MNITIDQQFAREALDYDPETGVFTWKERPRHHFESARSWGIFDTKHSGKPAGHIGNHGYRMIGLGGRQHLAHHLAWLMEYGYMPEKIDHKNRDPKDNRIKNLRLATQAQNAHNSKIRTTNTTGVAGVSYDRENQKWRASIKFSGRSINLGRFVDFSEAVAARRAAEVEMFGDFAPLP